MDKKIVIAGGTGLIGSRLCDILNQNGFKIRILSRSKRENSVGIEYAHWEPDSGILDPGILEDASVIINLAGAGIADKPWSPLRKAHILESRLKATECIRSALSKCGDKIPVYIAASAVGFYGDRGSEILDEGSSKGEGFLSDVCSQWEKAHASVDEYVHRSAILRIGIVMSSRGGAVDELIKKSLFGTYAYFGNGKAYYPWIHIDDLCAMILACINNDDHKGIFNACAKEAVSNKQFVKAIADARKGLGLLVPAPEFAIKLLLGEMAETVLTSARVQPKAFEKKGFQFKFETISEAAKDIIDRKI